MLTQGPQNFNTMKTPGAFGQMGNDKYSSVSVGTGQAFKHVMENIIKQVDDKGGKGQLNLKSFMNCDDIGLGKGNDLIDKLSQNLNLKGMDPGKLAVDEEGLAALGELLSGLGFDKGAVEGFLNDLKGNGAKSEVPLVGLFNKLGKFLKDNEAHETMDISALPYLESALSSFGLNPASRANLMEKALNKGNGIDLEELVAGLGRIEQNTENNGRLLSGGMKTSVNNLMSGLGMEESAGGTVTLKDFISRLEAKIGQKSGKFTPGSVSDSLSETFANNIHVSKKSGGEKGRESHAGLNGGKNSGSDLFFDKKTFQHKQHLSEDSFESRMFDGKMGKNVKPAEQAFIKDHQASPFEKAVKGHPVVSKEGDESGNLSGKTLVGSEILQKAATFKSVDLTQKTLPSYVTDQVARQISNAVRNGESEIKFQITPPELGRLELSIETTKSGLKISIMAEHNATRDMLLSNTGDLKTLLSEHGIKLDKIDVDLSSNFGQSMANTRQERGGSGKGKGNRDSSEFSLDKTKGAASDESKAKPVRYRKGNLDLVA